MKTVDQCKLYDDFDDIFVSCNCFWVIASIWYICVLQCYKFRPCNPKIQAKYQ